MSTTPIAYADEFDCHHAMQWGWMWANISGHYRWHLTHTFEDAAETVRVRFIDHGDEDGDFVDAAEPFDGSPFVPLMPPGHAASLDGQSGANRRVQVWFGDGLSICHEWICGAETGERIARRARSSFEALMRLDEDCAQ